MKTYFTLFLLLILNTIFGQVTNVKASVWSDQAGWSNNVIPTDTTNIILSYDITIDINSTCKSLTTNGHNVVVDSGVTFNISANTVTDIDGNVYSTITACSRTWMQKNLTVSRYRNGDLIPQVPNPNEWDVLTTGAWCWYNNDSATYGATYGKLYNWYAATDPRGLAPQGWHIPSDTEWTTLSTCLGGDAMAGGAMKEAGTEHWLSPNYGATNSSNFTGLPGGIRLDQDGYFGGLGESLPMVQFNKIQQ